MSNHAHVLMRSGPGGVALFMRRILTGHAISYNRRHRRHGHLFQNRYKSIICEEDAYFTELVRYIHLNPLRAGLVDALAKLDRYPFNAPWEDGRWLNRFAVAASRKRGCADFRFRQICHAGDR